MPSCSPTRTPQICQRARRFSTGRIRLHDSKRTLGPPPRPTSPGPPRTSTQPPWCRPTTRSTTPNNFGLHILWNQRRHRTNCTSRSDAIWPSPAPPPTTDPRRQSAIWACLPIENRYRRRILPNWPRPDDAIKLAVLFPTKQGEEQLVGIPLTLPMGWSESPPAFCTTTETAADLANSTLATAANPLLRLPHRLDDIAETAVPLNASAAPWTPRNITTHVPIVTNKCHYQRPLQYWDVYVDDHLGATQGSPSKRKRVKRALLHALDLIFRPLSDSDGPHRQEPASIKKLLKGDGTWLTRKILLG